LSPALVKKEIKENEDYNRISNESRQALTLHATLDVHTQFTFVEQKPIKTSRKIAEEKCFSFGCFVTDDLELINLLSVGRDYSMFGQTVLIANNKSRLIT
jgi:hypothetical protein